jgi:hypothetical protein
LAVLVVGSFKTSGGPFERKPACIACATSSTDRM